MAPVAPKARRSPTNNVLSIRLSPFWCGAAGTRRPTTRTPLDAEAQEIFPGRSDFLWLSHTDARRAARAERDAQHGVSKELLDIRADLRCEPEWSMTFRA
jgi:hypothetical protein